MPLIRAIINLILYSNLWIALAALAMAAQTQLLLSGQVQPTPLLGFILFATLFLYAVHRIVGLEKAQPFLKKGRYYVISRFRSHITFYAIAAGLGAAVFFLQLSFRLQLAAVAPSLIALGYVLPFLSGRRRLRDLSYVKIFLIAIAWSWITVLLPALELGMGWSIPMAILLLERAFFIFAITLPFDIRDLEVDAYNQVKTLPAQLGYRRTKALAMACLMMMAALAGLNHHLDVYSNGAFFALLLSALIAFALIYFADKVKHDYYFSGLIDGLMVLQFLLVWGLE
ncbi:MAG: UbiA family prenyltransferase [Lewinellaceae bacterium]|nr:UbiA family prenyltransferase [Phaeodactylibacter sp.]MCB9350810.1 UbiA family prenyltransferase [Lewinellaceae bacterium]